MALLRQLKVAAARRVSPSPNTTSMRSAGHTLAVRSPVPIVTSRPTAILPPQVPTGPSQEPDSTAIEGFIDQGLPRSIATSLVASGSVPYAPGAPGVRTLNANTPRPTVPTGKSPMAYTSNLTITGGGSGGGLSLPSGGPSLIDRGVGIVEDFIRSRLIPGSSGGNGSAQVPGASNLVATGTCPDGSLKVAGKCLDLQPGGSVSGGGMVLNYGEAVMGRYGAALVPAMTSTTVHRCPRGAVLGNDGLCYNKRDLRRSDRMWVPGRKPLLTGGDLNAISKASRAAAKMKTQSKRLQKLGLLPKPKSGRAPARRARPSIVNIDND